MAVGLKILSAAALVAMLVAAYIFYRPVASMPDTTLTIGSTTVAVDIADTEALRQRGLSGRANLPEGRGMWFVFEQDGVWGIWMKDMRFPIDIIWADADGLVVTVAHDISPDTYPQSFVPTAPARYVLEVPAGFAARSGIAEGSKIVVQ